VGTLIIYYYCTRSEVDHNVDEKDGVGQAVERDPPGAEIVVEERNGHGKDDQIGHEQQKHAKIPVKPEITNNQK
jgi:hypothetical protein